MFIFLTQWIMKRSPSIMFENPSDDDARVRLPWIKKKDLLTRQSILDRWLREQIIQDKSEWFSALTANLKDSWLDDTLVWLLDLLIQHQKFSQTSVGKNHAYPEDLKDYDFADELLLRELIMNGVTNMEWYEKKVSNIKLVLADLLNNPDKEETLSNEEILKQKVQTLIARANHDLQRAQKRERMWNAA